MFMCRFPALFAGMQAKLELTIGCRS